METKDRTIVTLPNGIVQIDPYCRKMYNDRWLEEVRKDGVINYDYFSDKISKGASKLVVTFVLDIINGKNLLKGSSKRPRSANTITNYRARLPRVIELMETSTKKNLLDLDEDDVLGVFQRMREGLILTKRGLIFKDVQTQAKFFAAFWRWHIRVNKKLGIQIPDLVSDLDLTRDKKPEWEFFNYDDVQRMVDFAPSLYYRALVLFLFDSGIRAPKEMMNVRVKDLTPIPDSDNLFLQIRHDTAKTFGRKIKLMISSDMIKRYILQSKKKPDDFLFDKKYNSMNAMIKKIGFHILGKGERCKNKRQQHKFIGGISMYDFRHCSVCHYLPIYNSENQLKYRYGWRKAEMIHYYSEYMGMIDTISEEDMGASPIKVSNDLEIEKQKVSLLQEQLVSQQKEMEAKMNRMEAMIMQKFAENY